MQRYFIILSAIFVVMLTSTEALLAWRFLRAADESLRFSQLERLQTEYSSESKRRLFLRTPENRNVEPTTMGAAGLFARNGLDNRAESELAEASFGSTRPADVGVDTLSTAQGAPAHRADSPAPVERAGDI